MKNIIKYMAGALFAGLTMTACSPEKFDGPDQAGVPTSNGADFDISVDQSINQVTVSYNQKGSYPIWSFDGGKTYSTQPTVSKIFALRGDYQVSMKIGNRNGISQGEVTKTFTMNQTQVDFDSYKSKFVGKEWRIKYDEAGHMGCGPSGTDGLGWWSAAPGDKADWGVYDDRITFSNDGAYTYNPGAGGTVYVNWGCSIYPEYNINKASETDFTAPVDPQTSSYTLDADADGNVVIKLAAKTLFPYIANDEQFNGGEYRIESLSNKKMSLIIDNGNIAWHFILTSEEDKPATPSINWVAVDSPDNLGAGFNTVGTMEFWWADAGWGQIGNPEFSYADGVYTITATENGGAEWQAQNSIHHAQTNIVKDEYYNIRFKINASAEVGRFTFKICDEGNDDNTLIYKNDLELAAGDNVIELKDIKSGGSFTEAKLFIDLGGITPGTTLKLSDIIVQKGEEPTIDESDPKLIDWAGTNSDANLGAAFNTAGVMNFWWADAGWGQIGNPEFSYADGVYTIVATENGGAEWQAQCSIQNVAVNIEEGQTYDLSVKITTSAELERFTVKLCAQDDDDNTLFYNGKVSADKGENLVQFANIKKEKGSFSTGKFFVDLGGVPVGTEVKISDIIVQKHKLK
jgi:hypothetical protein